MCELTYEADVKKRASDCGEFCGWPLGASVSDSWELMGAANWLVFLTNMVKDEFLTHAQKGLLMYIWTIHNIHAFRTC